MTELGIFSVMWSEHCSYKSSRDPPEEAADRRAARAAGARRERRRRRHRRRPRRRLQDRIAQPSVVHRAVPGRRDRRRRHHPRHLHDGRAADRAAELAALRPLDGPTARARAASSKASSPASPATATASASRPSAARSRSTSPTPATRWSTCFCLGIAKADALVKGKARGVGNPGLLRRREDRPRRHPRRDDGVGGVRRQVGGEAAGGAGRRSVHGEAAARGVPRADGRPTRSSASRTWARPGLTCSTCEMGARGGTGIEIDVTHVPQRETGMTPYEIMLSESQERMLLVVKKGREAEVERSSRSGTCTPRTSARSPTTACCASRITAWSSPRFRTARWSTRRRSTTGRSTRPAYLRRRRARSTSAVAVARAAPTGRAARSCSRRRRSPASGGSTGSTTTWCAPTRSSLAGHGRRRRARQGHDARAGDVDRRQRPLLLPRSAPRRDAGGRGGGAQRRVRRRPCRSAPPTA